MKPWVTVVVVVDWTPHWEGNMSPSGCPTDHRVLSYSVPGTANHDPRPSTRTSIFLSYCRMFYSILSMHICIYGTSMFIPVEASFTRWIDLESYVVVRRPRGHRCMRHATCDMLYSSTVVPGTPVLWHSTTWYVVTRYHTSTRYLMMHAAAVVSILAFRCYGLRP